MPVDKNAGQKGNIATIVALVGLGVLTIGIFAGKQLVDLGTQFLPKATGPLTISHYFIPVADSYTDMSQPTVNFGPANTIAVSGLSGKVKEGYLGFSVNGINTKIVKAELRLTMASDGKKNGPAVYLAENYWTEKGINHTNRPNRIGNAIIDLGTLDKNRPVVIDVTQSITGDGLYTFALIPTSPDSMQFYSRDSSVYKPMLTIMSEVSAVPTLVPSATPTCVPLPIFTAGDATTSALISGTPPQGGKWCPMPTSTPTPTVTPTCNDSDGGINIFQKGTTTGLFSTGGSGTIQDQCVSTQVCLLGNTNCVTKYSVNEGYCANKIDGKSYVTITQKDCQFGCGDGACFTSAITATPTLTLTPTPTIKPTITLTPTPSGPTLTPTPTSIYANGDANEDGYVDGIDYVIWLNHYNKTTTNLHKDGDFNRDGKVDGLDYVIWLTFYKPAPTPTVNITATPVPSLTPTLTPAPTCMPLPACAYGVDDGSGHTVYCDVNPSFNWCPRPTLTPTAAPPTPIPTCRPLPPFCVEWNDGIATNLCDWLNQPTYCGLPQCTPRPACADDPTPCALTADICRPEVPTPTVTPTVTPVPATCNQSCNPGNSGACVSGLSCTAVVPYPPPNDSTPSASFYCRMPACGYDNSCGCKF